MCSACNVSSATPCSSLPATMVAKVGLQGINAKQDEDRIGCNLKPLATFIARIVKCHCYMEGWDIVGSLSSTSWMLFGCKEKDAMFLCKSDLLAAGMPCVGPSLACPCWLGKPKLLNSCSWWCFQIDIPSPLGLGKICCNQLHSKETCGSIPA